MELNQSVRIAILSRIYSFTSRQTSIAERNVIGIIEGTDPLLKDQYIVLSAHFDHIGIRPGLNPDSIRNGADDNAAGTCTIIGIAKALSQLNIKPGRTILLAAFSGEEYRNERITIFCVPYAGSS